MGFEKTFNGGLLLRVDAFERLGSDLRRRYESLFDPIPLFPEGAPDRVRLLPQRSAARGLEFFVQGRPRNRFQW